MSFVNLPVQMFTRFIATRTPNAAPLTVKQSVTKHTYEIDCPLAKESDCPSNYTNISDITSPLSDMIDIDRDSLPMTQLLGSLTQIQERAILAQNGYKKIKKICNTLQGELFEAESIYKNKKHNKFTIKKCDKILLEEHVSFADENDMHFCVHDDIHKEAAILRYLNNKDSCNNMSRYIDFFESQADYYLVLESETDFMKLKEFVNTAHKYIENGKLKRKEYAKIIKYIMWQLLTAINWLHNDMYCTHLRLCIENISLQNAEFIEHSNGQMRINPSITVKISDFVNAEIFEIRDENKNNFYCTKYCETTERSIQYFSPKLYNEEMYDARKCDIFAIGMILYECAIGKPIYNEIKCGVPEVGSGRWAVLNNCIKTYLQSNDLLKNVNSKMLQLISNLLNTNEMKRFSANQALRHDWFKSYYARYASQIERKSIAQKRKLQNDIKQNKMKNLPYYVLY